MLDQKTAEQLVDELERLGVHFIRKDAEVLTHQPLEPVELLAGLACSPEARLRLSLIPLLLWRSDYANAAQAATDILSTKSTILLQCYYTAAYLLQQKHAFRLKKLGVLWIPLPDFFSNALCLPPAGTIDDQLYSLAQQQARLSGEAINWLGTYYHAAETFILHLEREAVWTA